jgi:hypothetical protein
MHVKNVSELLDRATDKFDLLSRTLRGKFKGRKVSVHVIHGDNAAYWDFRVECSSPLQLEILPEDAQNLERSLNFPKSGVLGFGRADDVNDPELEKQYDFRSSDPDRFKLWIQHPEIKNSLRALSFYSRHIILRDREIQFTITEPDLLTVPEMVLKHLTIMAASVEQNFSYPPGKVIPKMRSMHLRILIYIVIGSLLAIVVYFLSRPN